MELGFVGKVVVVTGAGAGIGAETARKFSEEGAKVIVADVDPVRGERVVKEIREKNGDALFVETDVSSLESVNNLFNEVVSHFGKVDILVNNAGIYAKGDILSFEEETYQKIMSVNVKGVLLCSKRAAEEMVKHKNGVIVNVASEAGLVAIANQMLYNLTKAAVISITKSCAVDLAPYGVRVNCVCPGTTYTPLVENALSKEQDPVAVRKKLEESRPLNRLGDPTEIATAILFLASPKMGYATGAVLSVDGGYTVW
ncbi:glucose 1-dehydrogenase [Thermatribacter velox]|uniref:Glucose 1-dehydrogenase n=1 Tax=Thermatribacter velox TaxID=3039681 RepID=A0ABZ2YCR5_9BACT